MMISTNKRVHSKKYIEQTLRARDKSLKVAKIDKIYYPYALMVYQIEMKNPKSLLHRKMLCVMDLAAGRGAIGDEDPELVEKEVDEVLVVDAKLTEEEMKDRAHDFIFKAVMSKVRVLYVPQIVLKKTEIFYKLFYIVQCKDPTGLDYFLLADSLDASFTVLDY